MNTENRIVLFSPNYSWIPNNRIIRCNSALWHSTLTGAGRPGCCRGEQEAHGQWLQSWCHTSNYCWFKCHHILQVIPPLSFSVTQFEFLFVGALSLWNNNRIISKVNSIHVKVISWSSTRTHLSLLCFPRGCQLGCCFCCWLPVLAALLL